MGKHIAFIFRMTCEHGAESPNPLLRSPNQVFANGRMMAAMLVQQAGECGSTEWPWSDG